MKEFVIFMEKMIFKDIGDGIMIRKITDLEDFALEEIIKPYQNLLEPKYQRSIKLPFSLNKIAHMLLQDTRWAGFVKNRLSGLNYYFPDYIEHSLVKVLRNIK